MFLRDASKTDLLESPHTRGHVQCLACERFRAMNLRSLSQDLLFSDAAAIYLELRGAASASAFPSGRYIRESTGKDYATKLRSLELFFGSMRLADIRWYQMRAYQQARLTGAEPFLRYRRPQDARPKKMGAASLPPRGKTACAAKPQQVNQELRLLKKLKQLAGCWTEEDDAYYQALQQQESDVERALSPEHQQLWLDTCRSNPRWEPVYHWSLVSFDLLTSTNELRGLRIGDVNLGYRIVRVPWASAKNRFRHREIPVEDPTALWALDRLLARAWDLGARDPQHYLFPFRVTRKKEADPTRPMTSSGLKKLWQEVREASGLLHFRMYDTRHTGATRMAESGVPAPVIMARMGHSNLKMQQHYQHISERAQRAWLRHARQYPVTMPKPPQPAAGTYRMPVQNFSQKSY